MAKYRALPAQFPLLHVSLILYSIESIILACIPSITLQESSSNDNDYHYYRNPQEAEGCHF
jgi:hypothetical protein